MFFAVDLVSEDFVQDYVFRAAEQVFLHLRYGHRYAEYAPSVGDSVEDSANAPPFRHSPKGGTRGACALKPADQRNHFSRSPAEYFSSQ